MDMMIANNYFRNTAISISDVAEDKEEILEIIKEYEKAQLSRDVLHTLAETGKAGEVTQDRVNAMLDYAENVDIYSRIYGTSRPKNRKRRQFQRL